MLRKLHGYAGHGASFKTLRHTRGMFGYPLNLFQRRGEASSELDYDQWCAALEAAGVNLLRIPLTGRQPIWGPNRQAAGFEPPPAGSFNPWLIPLDPSRLGEYRAQQVRGEMTPEQWQNSNLGQLITAAKNHGIKFSVVPFDNVEFKSAMAWRYHAWNSNNRYINGQVCEPQDRGFVAQAQEVFTDPRAIEAAKARLDFIIKAFEGTDVIACWELCEEMTWCATSTEFWGLTVWDDRMRANIREKLVPWVDEMARYIKQKQPGALVGNAHAFLGSRTEFPADPDSRMNVVNEIHQVESLDLVFINWYKSNSLSRCRAWLRSCQEHFAGKQVLVSQYAPYSLQRTEPYTDESAPYPESKGHEWLHTCGVPGFVGPQRWLGIREEQRNVWETGGLADPGMMEIGGVTNECGSSVDLNDWVGPGTSQDGQIHSPDLSLVSSWGDGQHVTMFLSWPSDGAKTITVDGLQDQDYVFYLFDWISGNLISTQDLTAAQGRLVITQVPTRDGALAGYVARKVPNPTPPTSMIRLVFRNGATLDETTVELEANQSYELVVSSFEST